MAAVPCQGLPDRPCPRLRCDATVRNTIYDLFLCRDCEKIRDESDRGKSASAATTEGSSLVTATKDKTKPKQVAASKDTVKEQRKQATRRGTKTTSSAIEDAVPITTNQLPTATQPQLDATDFDIINDLHTGNDNGDCAACPHCLLATDEGRVVRCDICLQHYHQKCTAMSAKIYDKFIMHVDVTGWVCDVCKDAAKQSYRRLAAAVAHLAEQVAALKADAAAAALLKSEAPNLQKSNLAATDQQEDPAKDESKTVLIVQRTINDSARRKRNVVVTGLPEQEGVDDRSLFLAFCEGELPMKPVIAENSCIRLGKKISDKPRRLLVKLNSEETATRLLSAAPLLRNSSDRHVANNVYINADLSPAAAQLAFEARQARRQAAERRRNAPNNSESIAATVEASSAATAPTLVNINNDRNAEKKKEANNPLSQAAVSVDALNSLTLTSEQIAVNGPPSFRSGQGR